MTESDIYEKLTPTFRDVFDDDDITPHAEMTADDVEEWDSLSHIRLIVTVEKEFNIRVSTAELSQLKSVGDLVQLISAKTALAG